MSGVYGDWENRPQIAPVAVSKTRPNNVTPYTANQVVGTSPASNWEFNINVNSGSLILLHGAKIRIDVAAIPVGMSLFDLHLFDAAPTPLADGAAFAIAAADRDKYLGFITIPTPSAVGGILWAEIWHIGKLLKLSDISHRIHGVLTTLTGYTPTAQAVKTVELSFLKAV